MRSGSSRRSRGSITGSCYRRSGSHTGACRSTALTRRSMPFGARTRRALLVGAVLAAPWLLVAGYLVAQHGSFVDRVDHAVGQSIAAFADRHPVVERTAEVVAQLFRVLPMTVYTLVAVGVLLWKGFRRTAIWVLVVSAGCLLSTTVVKVLLHRPRPAYAHMHLADGSFPSGHSSGTAC